MDKLEFFENDLDIHSIIFDSIHFKNTTAIDTLLELLENSINVLQCKVHNIQDNTTLELYKDHSYVFNKLMNILHKDLMDEAIKDVLKCMDSDDSGDDTE